MLFWCTTGYCGCNEKQTRKNQRYLSGFSFFRNIFLSQCTGEQFLSHPLRIMPLRLRWYTWQQNVSFPFESPSSQSWWDDLSVSGPIMRNSVLTIRRSIWKVFQHYWFPHYLFSCCFASLLCQSDGFGSSVSIPPAVFCVCGCLIPLRSLQVFISRSIGSRSSLPVFWVCPALVLWHWSSISFNFHFNKKDSDHRLTNFYPSSII